jgi:hypothetical protein
MALEMVNLKSQLLSVYDPVSRQSMILVDAHEGVTLDIVGQGFCWRELK